MLNSWILIFCLARASCLTIDFDSEKLCNAAKARIGDQDAVAYCVKRREYL